MDYKKADGLRTLSSALKVVAWIVLVLGLIAGITAMVAAQQAGEEVAQRAPTAVQETGDERAAGVLEATGTGLTATGITGGILAIVMSVVWFLILYALGSICDATADIWSNEGVPAGERATSRREFSTGEPGYTTPPPARSPT